MRGPATFKISGAASTTALLVALAAVTVLPVPRAQAAWPGRNGALLVWGESRWTQKGDSNHRGEDPKDCARWYPRGIKRPRLLARIADDDQSDSCRAREGVFRVGPGRFGVRPLTDRWSMGDGDADLSLSPGGTRLAFLRDGRLALASARGEGRVTWLGVPGGPPRGSAVRSPSWSPDGARLVYEQSSPGPTDGGFETRRSLIRIVRANGRGTRTLTVGCGPTWSVRGLVAFYRVPPGRYSTEGCATSTTREAGLFTMRPDGTHLRRIVRGSLVPPADAQRSLSWSPDGKALAFVAEDRTFVSPLSWLYRVGANATGLRRVAQSIGGRDIEMRHPIWSPDGRLIAFGSGSSDTYTVPSNPGEPVGYSRWRKVVAHGQLLDWESWR